jgi:hypothetical protein
MQQKKSNGNSHANFESASTRQNGVFRKYAILARLADIHQAILRGLARLADIPQTMLWDSQGLPTFAKPFCEDSPDLQKVSLVSVTQIWQVWQIWRV